MSVSNKIRGAVSTQGKKASDAAAALGISPQAWRNKLARQSFNSRDLIILAAALGCRLQMINNKGVPVAVFDLDDLPPDLQPEQKNNQG